MLRAPFILLANVFKLLGYVWTSLWFEIGYLFRRKKKLYLRLKLDGTYQFGPKTGLARYFQQKPSFLELRKAIERIRDDDTVAGVVLVAESTGLGFGQLAEVSRLLDDLREAGKHVVGHTQMPTTRDYLLLTCADDILMAPAGRLYSFGPRFDQYFGREALDKLGVVPQFIHIGEFKTASHRFIHQDMTPAQGLMMRCLYDSLKDVLIDRVQQRRGVSAEQADRLFAEAPMTAKQAWRSDFIDGEMFGEAIVDWLDAPDQTAPMGRLAGPSARPGDGRRAHDDAAGADELSDAPPDRPSMIVEAADHLDAAPAPFEWKPLFRPRPRIAVLDLSGMIVMPNMSIPGQGTVVIDPHEAIPAIRDIRQNPRCAGAILHINSPGGSALASDTIWQAIEQLRRDKPVVAQCSNVVGSGGYYLAVGADHIICERHTMTGSIGVVAGKMSAPDIPRKVGVNVESIYDHDADTFSSITRPLSDAMMDRMSRDARAFYRRFLQRVGQARKLPRRRLHRYARGRVYLGNAARQRGLIDEIGGFDAAVDRVASMCDMMTEDVDIEYVGHRQESLKTMVANSVQAGVPAWLADACEPAVIAALLERDPVLSLMPVGLDAKPNRRP